ncbi:hypothetical protein NMG60_11030448 [Bertholletia excelsa]
MITGHSSPEAQEEIECVRLSKEPSFIQPHYESYTHSLLSRFVHRGANISQGPEKVKSPGVSYDFRNIYGWMNEISLAGLNHQVNSIQIGSEKTDECFLSVDSNTLISGNLDDRASPADYPTIETDDNHSHKTNKDGSSAQIKKSVTNSSITSLCSDYFLEPLPSRETNKRVFRNPISRLHTDYCLEYIASEGHTYEHCQHKNEDGHLHENNKNQQIEFPKIDKSRLGIGSPTGNKLRYGFAKQEHAFAGALAGIFVSLCLHPVDTIKTVIQSCRADQRPIHYISRSIISERGLMGLYRGVASNIASSAPISAVYTFTYESIKGALLPLLPKECQSFAHCMAGGCASVATSFIFTPSERIKQQMQVGLHYQNCWNAFVGIIGKGGLPSLYTGWGAVLCRNVPHSIIKFYTYESLKQLMSSLEPNAQPNTVQTLVCGGLAGSTAALFTTPFDVVKTRLQTQIPGSIRPYNGVFNTIKEIGKHEGLKGLYRGLIPRLVIYMSHGAIFFSSYETFKRLFALDVSQLCTKTIEYAKNMDDAAP